LAIFCAHDSMVIRNIELATTTDSDRSVSQQ